MSATKQARTRRPDIQGLRAIAVAAVVVFHAGLPLPGGFVGVDVFFVISGFVITAMLLRELAAADRIDLRRFYTRRVRRLMPALALMLVATAIGAALLQSPLGYQQDTAVVGAAAVLWVANIAIYDRVGGYFDRAADQLPLLHTWSLSVEEQFYVFFPLLVLLAWRLGRRSSRAVVLAVSLICVLSLAFGLAATYEVFGWVDRPREFAFYMSPARAWEFGAGALLAVASHTGRELRGALAVIATWVGLAGLATSLLIIHEGDPFPGITAALPVVASVLVIAGGATASPMSRALSARPMRWLGDVSYSWYLWHWPPIVFATLLWPGSLPAMCLAGALSILPAWASYRWVESPIRAGTFTFRGPRPKESVARERAGRLVPVIAGAMLLPLLLYIGLHRASLNHWGSDRISQAAYQAESFPVGYDEGCHEGGALPERDLNACTWNRGGEPAVYLVGDSNAGMYADGLVIATEQTGQRLVIGVRSNCPFIDLTVHGSTATEQCRAYVDGTLDWLATQPPATVILAAAADEITRDDVSLGDPATGALATTTEQKAQLWQQSQAATTSALREAGHRVVLIGVVPHFFDAEGRAWSTAGCSTLELVRGSSSCGQHKPLAEADAEQQLALQAERHAAAQPGVDLLDPRPQVCQGEVCGTVGEEGFTYRDGKHLSRSFSEQLAPWLREALEAPDGD